jgi:hypothetical protein
MAPIVMPIAAARTVSAAIDLIRTGAATVHPVGRRATVAVPAWVAACIVALRTHRRSIATKAAGAAVDTLASKVIT